MGQDLFVKQQPGNGAPLLMLHGWGQSHDKLLPLSHLLSPLATPHLIDLPGFGNSPHPGATWSAYDYADRILRYLDEKKIQKADLLGHSFGGKVALCFAIRYPDRINRLILLAPSGLQRQRSFKEKCRSFALKYAAKSLKFYDQLTGSNTFSEKFAPKFGSRDYQSAGNMRPILVKSVNEDLSPELSKIQCKTLLLWGGRDQETPVEMGRQMHDMISHSSLRLFPHHDHYLFEDTAAHLVGRYIRQFLEEKR